MSDGFNSFTSTSNNLWRVVVVVVVDPVDGRVVVEADDVDPPPALDVVDSFECGCCC